MACTVGAFHEPGQIQSAAVTEDCVLHEQEMPARLATRWNILFQTGPSQRGLAMAKPRCTSFQSHDST